MSILIKSMEMPKTESEVLIIAIKSDGSVYPVRIDGDGQPMVFPNEEMKNCAVPVPPHGRLIDADALKDLYHYNTHDSDIDKAWTCNIRRSLDNAPTVIPASEEG